ncbi:N-glycosylase/DNA lyase, partial [Candidatus Vampirococcus lugosii]|nr:N-glycosylase [Candidatus Vampirococcus lugosii]
YCEYIRIFFINYIFLIMLQKYLENYNINYILDLEEKKDLQYINIKKSWIKINEYKNVSDNDKFFFIKIIIYNSLISYQLSGTGEKRWQEFAEFLYQNFDKLLKNIELYKTFLINSKNNRRLINMKIKRLKKIDKFFEEVDNLNSLINYYQNMTSLNTKLAYCMKQKKTAKTIVFSIKMFAYSCRIVFDKIERFPFDICIPLDSRIKKIYEINTGNKNYKESEIIKYFDDISKKIKIAPLHIDSLLWVDYWKNEI